MSENGVGHDMTHAALLRDIVESVRAAGVAVKKIAAHVDRDPSGLHDEIDDLAHVGNLVADSFFW